MADAATLAAIGGIVGTAGTSIAGIILAIAQFRDGDDDDITKAERLRRKAARLERRAAERHDDDDDKPVPLFTIKMGVI